MNAPTSAGENSETAGNRVLKLSHLANLRLQANALIEARIAKNFYYCRQDHVEQ
jgi:hypothetical protein